MESVKKWLSERAVKKNGLYLHYSPPKSVGSVSGAQLRQWARGGAESRLERAVLAGQGRRLLAEAEAIPLAHHLPALMLKCSALHTALERGSLLELQELLEPEYNKRKYIMCTDEAGVGLLHKAIYYDYMDIAEWLVHMYPPIVHQKDSEGRTPLHYAAMCRDEAGAAALLEGAGAARGVRDAAGRTPAYYRGPARTNLVLPAPVVVDMARETRNNPPGAVIKRSNIRIWCHDCDMARLQRVVWDGHGARLLSEVSNQPVVKKFFEAVPYIMNTIRELHTAVVQNDLENVMKHSGDPIPAVVLSSRDTHNMTVFHKAAGLGHGGILRYICERYPQGINDVDNDGRTPLHYAAAVRDDQHTYNTLVGLGADESVMDNKHKTPAYYINRSQEIDKNLLKIIPDAPRTPSSAYPSSWDWKLLDTEVIAELNKKSRRKGFKQSTENISSNTVTDNTENLTNTMKTSSTQELIKDLPELDETSKSTKYNDNEKFINTKESEEVEEQKEPETIDEEPELTEETDEKLQDVENKIDNDDSEVEEKNDQDVEIVDKNEKEEQVHEKQAEQEPKSAVAKSDDAEDMKENLPEEKNESIDKVNAESEEIQTSKPDSDIENEEDNEGQDITSLETEEKKHDDKDEDKYQEDKEDKVEENVDEINKEKPNTPELLSEENDNNSIKNDNNETEVDADEGGNASLDANVQAQGAESTDAPSEGNHNKNDDEDDDDVQVQGETQSEYSDFNIANSAETSNSPGAKRGNQSNGRSAQDSHIEGLINGDGDVDTQDASLLQRDESVHGDVLIVDNEIDPEVTELINSINMEMLAALVLNGEGARLVGRHSSNAELEAFLENVPAYMKKIHKVHMAAREGNIRDLQAALDRRKFAIARDPISPNGATPLHVATIFGKTNIIKYLGGRFPETLSAVDFEGRTALHYAAILPDNGHYYNLLQQLGANSKDLDDNGHSAEEYFRNKNLMSLDQLFSDFGVTEDVMKNMLSDKGTTNTNGHMDIPIFRTEEGRYLAKSLGDPLIKGLTEVANVKPKDPIAFLASFLHNFPEKEKPRLGTQESNLLVTHEAPEVENETPAPLAATTSMALRAKTSVKKTERPIDVVTVDPKTEPSPDAPEAAFSSVNRDEHGQSMLHFAAARSHTRNALFQLLQESDINLAYRDELYRTARDVSIQANVADNTVEIDRWVLHLAARDNSEKIMELLLEGYDHILDVLDEDGVPIAEIISQRGLNDMSSLLASIPAFEESRESLHAAIRRGDLRSVQAAVAAEGGRTLARGKNYFGRTALHVAVLAQEEEIVSNLVNTCPDLLRIGDNLERTPLHYAMGVDKIESLSHILIRAGAKRVLKDLKGRQPSYYFMNKSDILRLKEEEDVH